MLRNLRSAGLALALAAIAAAPVVPAFAGEGNGPAFGSVGVEVGGLLPPGSNSQGQPQSANSLPQGFYNGTPVMQHRETLQNYWSGVALAARR